MTNYQIEAQDVSALEQQLIDLGNRVTSARAKAGLSQAELADAAGVSLLTVMRIEDGNGGVGSRNLLAVARRLDISLDPFPAVESQGSLPLYEMHLDDETVDGAVEEAIKLACEHLDETLFPDARAEVDGLSSNFQVLLKEHMRALLRGETAYRPPYLMPLKPLVYSDEMLGREYSLKPGADGYLVRLEGTQRVLDGGRFRLARKAGDMYTSWDAAAKAVKDFVSQQGHLPGPVRIVSGWLNRASETGVRFSAPAESPAAE
jgi:transcriptional regulator with XRE-family HTH domain